jgi:molybdate transport system regulatory protein
MKETNEVHAEIIVEGKIWFRKGDDTYLGLGKIELLEKIKECGTMSKAAEAMKISYRQAFKHIKKINSLSDKPLVILKHGGKGGGGSSQITEAGEKAIITFRKFQNDFMKFLQDKTNELGL